MDTTRDFSIKRRGLHFDTKKRGVVAEKNENTVYFASASEYACYLKLEEIFNGKYTINTQPRYKKGVLDWRLDFKIEAKTLAESSVLAAIARYCNDADLRICPFLLIEYKGFADANFRSKIKLLAEHDINTYNLLIVLSRKESIYTFFIDGKKYSKPIYTPEKIGYIISSLI